MQNPPGSTALNATDTAFGYRALTVQFEGGRTEQVKVRQLPLRDYEAAFAFIDDEMGLTAWICGRDKKWITGVDEAPNGAAQPAGTPETSGMLPDSYELLQAAAREVNEKGFFAWSGRRKARKDQELQKQIAAMAMLTPEQMEVAMQAGQRLLSPSSSPTQPRPPGSPGRR